MNSMDNNNNINLAQKHIDLDLLGADSVGSTARTQDYPLGQRYLDQGEPDVYGRAAGYFAPTECRSKQTDEYSAGKYGVTMACAPAERGFAPPGSFKEDTGDDGYGSRGGIRRRENPAGGFRFGQGIGEKIQ